ncbi:phage antirepressor KilAC domain-containing protein [Carnobacterium maltaromaticum]|uniref:phage antirepressor KilAC domain-containing protein n=1 Tax=Carnobacterium maltaromaticum TaxID=2751 RepID=UPI00298B9217|nr:phage antirepressor KilAC domain-containing protein [Carnobacterium maltaromaticum]MDW5523635.1 phage antirepressor KilAC domain-containing protein [Carnobacterium maltaromaticum]
MTNLQKFNCELFQLEVKSENGESLFNVESVARSLGFVETKNEKEYVIWKRVNKYLEKNLSTPVSKNDFISEPMVYKLAFKANNEVAEKFQDWLAIDVLPSLRKNGMYATDELLDNPDLLIAAATKLKEERALRLVAEQQVTELKPKALFADAVATSHTSILVGELAKIIKQNGVDIGANRLFHWLRANGFLIKRKGTDWNMPTQKSMELGLFEVKETAINRSDGSVSVSKTAKVTGKGQQYFINKFLNHELQLA